MRWLDYSFDGPAENLAFEEVLLEQVVSGACPAVLRFWESPRVFVVLGTAQVLAEEVYEAACLEDGIPIMRRCSAGGCVLQGPGSLNFTLALNTDTYPEVRGIRESYCHISACLRRAFAPEGLDLHHSGTSDLTLEGRKISGNAQRRRRNAMLHHGTLVYQANYAGMARYLREPADRPGYRGERDHQAFVGVVPLGPETLKSLVRQAFGAEGEATMPNAAVLKACAALAVEKYETEAWIRRR